MSPRLRHFLASAESAMTVDKASKGDESMDGHALIHLLWGGREKTLPPVFCTKRAVVYSLVIMSLLLLNWELFWKRMAIERVIAVKGETTFICCLWDPKYGLLRWKSSRWKRFLCLAGRLENQDRQRTFFFLKTPLEVIGGGWNAQSICRPLLHLHRLAVVKRMGVISATQEEGRTEEGPSRLMWSSSPLGRAAHQRCPPASTPKF